MGVLGCNYSGVKSVIISKKHVIMGYIFFCKHIYYDCKRLR